MLLDTLGTGLLGNMLTAKGILRAGYGNKEAKGMSRAGYGNIFFLIWPQILKYRSIYQVILHYLIITLPSDYYTT